MSSPKSPGGLGPRLLARAPLLLLGMVSLVAGVWGGLARLQVPVPLPNGDARWLTFHGPLMVCGFLGTVIGLERAVGLPQRWVFGAPLLTALGSLALLGGAPWRPAAGAITSGSALLVCAAVQVVRMRNELFTLTMASGAGLWLVGNILWLLDLPLPQVVPWWIGFLGLTIVGERLDLSRFQKPDPRALPLVLAALGLFLAGVAWTRVDPARGIKVTGAGLVSLALWLARFDIARKTVRQPGLPRFMALCLLVGYAWLAMAGLLLAAEAPTLSGPYYDAALHSFFLGFVFSMIFGHAPVIFPSVLGLPFAYTPRFYLHVALLHLSLLLRVGGDLAPWEPGRRWAGVFNALSIAAFALNTATSLASARKPTKR
ncbi:MAG TPA: hypothetical protein DCM86_15540 [Verrucomicrobiales bacterium]|nr:hypothetical protein [Verrucomicrobiales bacterium]